MNRVNMARELRKGGYRSVKAKRERGWDNRFILGKIPTYNAYHDRHFLGMKMFNDNNKIEYYKFDSTGMGGRTFSSTSMHNNHNSLFKSLKISSEDNEEVCDAIARIEYLWNQLGVLEEYRNLFGIVANQLDDNNRIDFFRNEINSLKDLSELLTTLTKFIQDREIMINGLRQANSDLGYMLLSSPSKIEEAFFDDVIRRMQQLRLSTIEICRIMSGIRDACSYRVLGGKFDLARLSSKFLFDKNYLIKMKEQLDFLKRSNLKNFFNLTEGDPFLLQPAQATEKNTRVVPINEEDLSEIKKCKYFILEDLIYYQSINLKTQTFRTISPITKKNKGQEPINYYMSNGKYYRSNIRINSQKSPNRLSYKYNAISPKASSPGLIDRNEFASTKFNFYKFKDSKNQPFRNTHNEFGTRSEDRLKNEKEVFLASCSSNQTKCGTMRTDKIRPIYNIREDPGTKDRKSEMANVDKIMNNESGRPLIIQNKRRPSFTKDEITNKDRPAVKLTNKNDNNGANRVNRYDDNGGNIQDSTSLNKEHEIKEKEEKERTVNEAHERNLRIQLEKEVKTEKGKYLREKELKEKEIEELKKQILEKDELLKKKEKERIKKEKEIREKEARAKEEVDQAIKEKEEQEKILKEKKDRDFKESIERAIKEKQDKEREEEERENREKENQIREKREKEEKKKELREIEQRVKEELKKELREIEEKEKETREKELKNIEESAKERRKIEQKEINKHEEELKAIEEREKEEQTKNKEKLEEDVHLEDEYKFDNDLDKDKELLKHEEANKTAEEIKVDKSIEKNKSITGDEGKNPIEIEQNIIEEEVSNIEDKNNKKQEDYDKSMHEDIKDDTPIEQIIEKDDNENYSNDTDNIAADLLNDDIQEDIEQNIKEDIKKEMKEEIKEEMKTKIKEEIKEEMREEFKDEIIQEIKEEMKDDIKEEMKDDIKEEMKDDIKEEIKDDIKDEMKVNIKEEMKDDIKEEMKDDIKDEMKDDIKDEMKVNIKEEMKDDIKEEMKDDIKDKMKDDIKDKMKDDIKDEMKDDIKDEMKDDIKDEMKVDIKDKMKVNIKEEMKVNIKEEIKDDIKDKMKDDIQEEMKDDIKDEMKDDIKDEMKDDIKEEMKDDIKDEMKDDIKDEMKDDIKDEMKDDIKEEMKDDIKEEIKDDIKDEMKDDIKEEMKVDIKDEMKDDIKEEMKVDIKDEMKDDIKEEIKVDIKEEMKDDIKDEMKDDIKDEINKEIKVFVMQDEIKAIAHPSLVLLPMFHDLILWNEVDKKTIPTLDQIIDFGKPKPQEEVVLPNLDQIIISQEKLTEIKEQKPIEEVQGKDLSIVIPMEETIIKVENNNQEPIEIVKEKESSLIIIPIEEIKDNNNNLNKSKDHSIKEKSAPIIETIDQRKKTEDNISKDDKSINKSIQKKTSLKNNEIEEKIKDNEIKQEEESIHQEVILENKLLRTESKHEKKLIEENIFYKDEKINEEDSLKKGKEHIEEQKALIEELKESDNKEKDDNKVTDQENLNIPLIFFNQLIVWDEDEKDNNAKETDIKVEENNKDDANTKFNKETLFNADDAKIKIDDAMIKTEKSIKSVKQLDQSKEIQKAESIKSSKSIEDKLIINDQLIEPIEKVLLVEEKTKQQQDEKEEKEKSEEQLKENLQEKCEIHSEEKVEENVDEKVNEKADKELEKKLAEIIEKQSQINSEDRIKEKEEEKIELKSGEIIMKTENNNIPSEESKNIEKSILIKTKKPEIIPLDANLEDSVEIIEQSPVNLVIKETEFVLSSINNEGQKKPIANQADISSSIKPLEQSKSFKKNESIKSNKSLDKSKDIKKVESIKSIKPSDKSKEIKKTESIKSNKPIDQSKEIRKTESIKANKLIENLNPIISKTSSIKNEEPVKQALDNIKNTESIKSLKLLNQSKELIRADSIKSLKPLDNSFKSNKLNDHSREKKRRDSIKAIDKVDVVNNLDKSQSRDIIKKESIKSLKLLNQSQCQSIKKVESFKSEKPKEQSFVENKSKISDSKIQKVESIKLAQDNEEVEQIKEPIITISKLPLFEDMICYEDENEIEIENNQQNLIVPCNIEDNGNEQARKMNVVKEPGETNAERNATDKNELEQVMKEERTLEEKSKEENGIDQAKEVKGVEQEEIVVEKQKEQFIEEKETAVNQIKEETVIEKIKEEIVEEEPKEITPIEQPKEQIIEEIPKEDILKEHEKASIIENENQIEPKCYSPLKQEDDNNPKEDVILKKSKSIKSEIPIEHRGNIEKEQSIKSVIILNQTMPDQKAESVISIKVKEQSIIIEKDQNIKELCNEIEEAQSSKSVKQLNQSKVIPIEEQSDKTKEQEPMNNGITKLPLFNNVMEFGSKDLLNRELHPCVNNKEAEIQQQEDVNINENSKVENNILNEGAVNIVDEIVEENNIKAKENTPENQLNLRANDQQPIAKQDNIKTNEVRENDILGEQSIHKEVDQVVFDENIINNNEFQQKKSKEISLNEDQPEVFKENNKTISEIEKKDSHCDEFQENQNASIDIEQKGSLKEEENQSHPCLIKIIKVHNERLQTQAVHHPPINESFIVSHNKILYTDCNIKSPFKKNHKNEAQLQTIERLKTQEINHAHFNESFNISQNKAICTTEQRPQIKEIKTSNKASEPKSKKIAFAKMKTQELAHIDISHVQYENNNKSLQTEHLKPKLPNLIRRNQIVIQKTDEQVAEEEAKTITLIVKKEALDHSINQV